MRPPGERRGAPASRGRRRADLGTQGGQGLMVEAAPDFRLPTSIETLDGVLKPVLAQRRATRV